MNDSLTLVIGNKNYSSWSMRPWVLMHGRGIGFGERMLKFESAEWDEQIGTLSPSGLVPALWEGEPGAGFVTHDTLAIAERLHELFPDHGIWPREASARARARSIAAEMHAGFRAMRDAMPMNIRGRYPGKGMAHFLEQQEVQHEGGVIGILEARIDGPPGYLQYSRENRLWAVRRQGRPRPLDERMRDGDLRGEFHPARDVHRIGELRSLNLVKDSLECHSVSLQYSVARPYFWGT